MLVSELWYKWGWLIVAFLFTWIVLTWQQTSELKKLSKQPQIKPCACLTLQQTLFHVEKVEMFVDQLQRAKRGQRNAIIDSINYHRTLLKSEGNLIEY